MHQHYSHPYNPNGEDICPSKGYCSARIEWLFLPENLICLNFKLKLELSMLVLDNFELTFSLRSRVEISGTENVILPTSHTFHMPLLNRVPGSTKCVVLCQFKCTGYGFVSWLINVMIWEYQFWEKEIEWEYAEHNYFVILKEGFESCLVSKIPKGVFGREGLEGKGVYETSSPYLGVFKIEKYLEVFKILQNPP